MTAILERSEARTLDELGREASDEHLRVLEAGASVLEHAIAAGHALLAARKLVAPGEWTAWIAANFVARSTSTAKIYMRLATYEDVVKTHEPTSIHVAHALLQNLSLDRSEARRRTGQCRITDETKADALAMRAAGATRREVAETFGVSAQTVNRWDNPNYAARQLEANRRWAKRRTEAQQALKRQEREREVARLVTRNKGKAKAEAYSIVAKLDQLLGRARSEAASREERLYINEAHAHRDKMMDALIKALGVS